MNFINYVKLLNEVNPKHRPPNGHSIFNKFDSLEWSGIWDCEKCMYYIKTEETIECDMTSCIHYPKLLECITKDTDSV